MISDKQTYWGGLTHSYCCHCLWGGMTHDDHHLIVVVFWTFDSDYILGCYTTCIPQLCALQGDLWVTSSFKTKRRMTNMKSNKTRLTTEDSFNGHLRSVGTYFKAWAYVRPGCTLYTCRESSLPSFWSRARQIVCDISVLHSPSPTSSWVLNVGFWISCEPARCTWWDQFYCFISWYW